VNSPTSTVIVAHGSLPLTITPAVVSNLWEMREEAALDLHASIRPEAFFWQSVSELAGITLVDPTLELNLAGTWRSPQGRILARARELALQHSSLTNLALSDLQLDLELDRQRARLAKGQVLVQGQLVSLNGELPLNDSSWKELFQKRLPSWRQATARLRIDDAKLAAFAPMFPEVLAPQGEINVDVRLLPGADLEGTMTLRHARTQPLGNTAPIRDINVTLRFGKGELALENATANLSGATVELTGRADMRGTNWMGGELPPFALTLRGTSVPLARQPEYIIRSDIDLAVIKTNNAPPIVVGSAHLRDSFFLSDFTALVPKIKAPAMRPPYFSIDNPTVSDWRLAVAVSGVRWLRVRTGVFNGEVTSNLHLEGTLKDPIAIGGVNVDSGLVRFPFANLELQQGLVTLTSQDPYHPQILVHATSRQFGYDIRMEITGSIDAPIVQFTSNPSLSSEQILLMITAGQLPQGALNLTPQQRAQTVAVFLGRDLLSRLGFGDQTEERLTITSGEEVSIQNRPTYRVQYKVAPRWSVIGEYDRFGDFNVGLKWRVYSR
jgi:translocation and assembly module TamB